MMEQFKSFLRWLLVAVAILSLMDRLVGPINCMIWSFPVAVILQISVHFGLKHFLKRNPYNPYEIRQIKGKFSERSEGVFEKGQNGISNNLDNQHRIDSIRETPISNTKKATETGHLSELKLNELNSVDNDRIPNTHYENKAITEKSTISDEQYKSFAESASRRVIEETKVQCMVINLEDETTSIFDSKVGGLPYLIKDFDVPIDSNGCQMKLLAQIDCNDLNGVNDYPHEGILQFWMTTKWAWEEAKVVYHKEVDRTITEKEVIQKIHEFKKDAKHSFPVNECYRMQFTLSSESISRYDYRLKALFCQYFTDLAGEYISDPEDAESEEVYNVFVDKCEERDDAYGNSHKVGGYRYSTQFGSWDYNSYSEGEKIDIHSDEAEVLLFQLDSDYAFINFETRKHDWIKVMWCDAGVGRFTIKRSELKKCDFENVRFSWDCS